MRAVPTAMPAVMLFACSGPAPAAPDAPLPTALPQRLSETGLYADFAGRVVAPGLEEFAPRYELWSDGADKRRWIELPAPHAIDSSDMDHWRFPVGTRWFKEFSRDGVRLETRLIWRVADTGNRERDTLFGAYLWADDDGDAYFVPDGAADVRGTDHDVPSAELCKRCHFGEPGHALGYAALQLGDVAGVRLSHPPAAGARFAAPHEALGYLHVNCGHCHNPNGGAWSDSRMVLRLDVGETTVAGSRLAATTIGAPLEQWINRGSPTAWWRAIPIRARSTFA